MYRLRLSGRLYRCLRSRLFTVEICRISGPLSLWALRPLRSSRLLYRLLLLYRLGLSGRLYRYLRSGLFVIEICRSR